jgi:hypothetical protein
MGAWRPSLAGTRHRIGPVIRALEYPLRFLTDYAGGCIVAMTSYVGA